MATIVYKNCKVFLDDTQIDAQLNEFSTDFKAELLDVTTFGNDYRIKAGGLKTAVMSGKGFFDVGTTQIDGLLFRDMGADETQASGLPVVLSVFPVGITEGTLTDFGYAMKGVVEMLSMGGAVGIVLPISFAVNSRGVAA